MAGSTASPHRGDSDAEEVLRGNTIQATSTAAPYFVMRVVQEIPGLGGEQKRIPQEKHAYRYECEQVFELPRFAELLRMALAVEEDKPSDPENVAFSVQGLSWRARMDWRTWSRSRGFPRRSRPEVLSHDIQRRRHTWNRAQSARPRRLLARGLHELRGDRESRALDGRPSCRGYARALGDLVGLRQSLSQIRDDEVVELGVGVPDELPKPHTHAAPVGTLSLSADHTTSTSVSKRLS